MKDNNVNQITSKRGMRIAYEEDQHNKYRKYSFSSYNFN